MAPSFAPERQEQGLDGLFCRLVSGEARPIKIIIVEGVSGVP
jgi:hypothetical protein